MNILIVEDEDSIAQGIKKIFTHKQMTNIVETSNCFSQGLSKYKSKIFDLILLDIFLGTNKKTGLDLLETIREKDKKTPIIMITGFQSVAYLEKAFTLGANDYIKKPFNSKEVELRVLRWKRFRPQVKFQKKIPYKSLSYSPSTNTFSYKNSQLDLTRKNKELLKLFIKKPEQLLTKQYIQEKLWGDYDNIEKQRNIRSNIQNLRKSLKSNCHTWIKTVRGEGYILKKPD